ncbi:BTAD domain-containing putative transcriptional regulator [Streptomyces sp. SL13]|uniref:BTAD domain-containing putative transcriptional regulator n=1 Tax=Streptantibioticus silvisoli TaxID=2705255 RepID=A0AA90HCB0_9ACTN|nr:AfsR/SARP family transcriptional regulator [Streptantibioticus silvisoli]MDI5974014.1 BTAD domain-containing putative transcriptional regulator [Streptantibioticus silvisoli]
MLGLLQVEGDEPVPITARRQQVVLVLLLLNSNRVVSLESLFEAIWGSAPPATARAQVQICVSALRRALLRCGLGERIQVRGGGYAIEVDQGELDLHRYEDLVVRGRSELAAKRPAAARAAFREALALWRGEPLDGIDSGVVRAHQVRISERRVEVLEDCVQAELQLGLHNEVVGEISAMVTEHPLRERLVGQLMTALYRCGRRAEALAVYRVVRQRFVDELGLEPGPSVNQLHQDILTGSLTGHGDAERPEPAMPWSSAGVPVPRMLPARVPYFTGHAELLAALQRRLVGDHGPHTELVTVLTGRGGVGKSTVANEIANTLAAEFPDGQLYARMAVGEEQAGNVSNILKQFLCALGFSASEVPAAMEDRAARYRSAIAGRRVLTVIDDVVDEAQVRPLIPGTPTCRLVMTTRARTAALLGTAVFELDVLGTGDGVELLAAMIGRQRVRAEPREAGELVGLCGGLPLALEGAAARLVARPHRTIGDLVALLRDERHRLDQLNGQGVDVRATLLRGYRTAPPVARALFARLGMLEPGGFGAWVAARLMELDAASATDALESLVDARLVDVESGTGGSTRYRLHELARIFARERLFAEFPSQDDADAGRRTFGTWPRREDEARSATGHGG